jgi:general L-amino acid transport system permease protein
VWIGYPELVAVTATAINLTGQALEPLFLIMLVYLAISLTLSILMNIYNSRTLRYAR